MKLEDFWKSFHAVGTGLVLIFTDEVEIEHFAINEGKIGNCQPYAMFPIGTNMSGYDRDKIFNKDLWKREIEYFMAVQPDVIAVMMYLDDEEEKC